MTYFIKKIMKKLSSLVRTIYSICRILPNYELKLKNNYGITFDYKLYSNKKLNNSFIENNYKKTNVSVDLDIAKMYLSIKYYLKNDIFLIEEKIKTKKLKKKQLLTRQILTRDAEFFLKVVT